MERQNNSNYNNFRVFDFYLNNLKNFDQENTLNSKRDNKWLSLPIHSLVEKGNALSQYLLSLGVSKGDKVALVSTSRIEWHLMDFAILQIGAINVPIYANITPKEYDFILNECKAKVLVVSDKELFENLKSVVKSNSNIKKIICFDKFGGYETVEEIINKQKTDISNLETLRKQISQSDTSSIIYTSGTTGDPKGVVLSHLNLVSNVFDAQTMIDVRKNYVALSFLPLNHVFERVVTYLYINNGVKIYFAESIDTLGDNLKEVKPDLFISVPRLLEKVYEKIIAKGNELTGIKKTLFFWSLNIAEQYNIKGKNSFWYNLKLSIARKLVFSKWIAALGGRIKLIVTGAAACQIRILKIFNGAGIKIREGYGLTETSPVISVNPMEDYYLGSTGKIIPNVNVKIADDGEILVKGPNVMQGYYNNDDATKEVFTSDGWLKTGDIGELIEGKYLKITDRKKEIFKTSGGKFIAPQYVENLLKSSKFIDQAYVIGESQKFPSAIIQPSWENLTAYCKIKGITFSSNSQVIENEKIINLYDREVEKINAQLAQYQKVKKTALTPDTWSVMTEELTPTMKLKRRVLFNKYQHIVENLYST